MDARHGIRLARRSIALGGLATLLVAGCTNDDDRRADQPPSTTAPTVSDPSAPAGSPSGTPSGPPSGDPSRPATPESTADAGPVTIAFAGDIHFEGALRSRLDDPETALAPIEPQLSEADLTIVNLESSIGTSGTPEPKRYIFQAPSTAFDALAAAGVDVVTMANNHAMDYGPDGLADTLDAAEQAGNATPPLSVVGVGADARRAFTPAMVEVRGTRVAVLGASTPDDPTADPTDQWAAGEDRPGVAVALDPERLLDAVAAARAGADVVVVYMHWGRQGESCPTRSQRDLATALTAAGADIVVGSHTHRLQGAGRLDGAYVAYGLGNFAWYTQSSAATSTTGVLTLTVDDGQVVEDDWAPAEIQPDGLPEFASGATARRMTDEFGSLRDCAGL